MAMAFKINKGATMPYLRMERLPQGLFGFTGRRRSYVFDVEQGDWDI